MPKGTVNTELVKQAYSKIQYDSDMLLDFQQCCDPNEGPMFFMKKYVNCLLYTSPSPRDMRRPRMPSSA